MAQVENANTLSASKVSFERYVDQFKIDESFKAISFIAAPRWRDDSVNKIPLSQNNNLPVNLDYLNEREREDIQLLKLPYVHIRKIPISGASLREVASKIHTISLTDQNIYADPILVPKEPLGERADDKFGAYTSCYLNYFLFQKDNKFICRPAFGAIVNVPDWIDVSKASKIDQALWSNYISKIYAHEAGHVRNSLATVVNCVGKIEEALGTYRFGGVMSADYIIGKATIIFNDHLKILAALDKRLDKTDANGKTTTVSIKDYVSKLEGGSGIVSGAENGINSGLDKKSTNQPILPPK